MGTTHKEIYRPSNCPVLMEIHRKESVGIEKITFVFRSVERRRDLYSLSFASCKVSISLFSFT
jgi:hypothetical protein